ncbi:unnamed protein product [Symbiodinium sp. CCMP2592]|nr:unnamed protein product [Symbiodinium sp. CCMP2592]CAE7545750.1 unnamed protein product [Symbiodinium sp. CCMP2592]
MQIRAQELHDMAAAAKARRSQKTQPPEPHEGGDGHPTEDQRKKRLEAASYGVDERETAMAEKGKIRLAADEVEPDGPDDVFDYDRDLEPQQDGPPEARVGIASYVLMKQVHH